MVLVELISIKNNLKLSNDNRSIDSLKNYINNNKLIKEKDIFQNSINNLNFKNNIESRNIVGVKEDFKIKTDDIKHINTVNSYNSIIKKPYKTLFKVVQYEELISNNNNNSNNTNHIRFICNNCDKNKENKENNVYNNGNKINSNENFNCNNINKTNIESTNKNNINEISISGSKCLINKIENRIDKKENNKEELIDNNEINKDNKDINNSNDDNNINKESTKKNNEINNENKDINNSNDDKNINKEISNENKDHNLIQNNNRKEDLNKIFGNKFEIVIKQNDCIYNNNENNINKNDNKNIDRNKDNQPKGISNKFLDTDKFARLEDFETLINMNLDKKIINYVCYIDNWRLLFGTNDLKRNKIIIILYEFINEKKNLISRLAIKEEFKEKINCILKLNDEYQNNKISKNFAICGKDCFIKIINIDLYQDTYKVIQTIYTGNTNYIYTMIEVKNIYLVSGQLKNILIFKKVNDFLKYTNSFTYKKVMEITTNSPIIKLIHHSNILDFMSLLYKEQKITFYENINNDLSSDNNDNSENENFFKFDDDKKNDLCYYKVAGNIKFASRILNIYMLDKEVLGCNDEESIFLININDRIIAAQILLGMKILCSRISTDLSLILSVFTKEGNLQKNKTELIQFILNYDKDNLVRLRNQKNNILGVDNFFCLENNYIIFCNSKKNNIIIMKNKKVDKQKGV